MIKSNVLKETVYPDGFTDEDKAEFDILYAQANLIHADIAKDNPYIIYISVVAYIRSKKGLTDTFTDEQLLKIKESYKLESKIIECKEPADSYLYDKDNNPIYFPSKLEITCDEKKDKVILEA